MKKVAMFAILLLALAPLCGMALAGEGKTWNGYLIDKMCGAKPERAANHSKSCTEKCASSGLGLVAEGKLLAFDEKGNQLGAELLKNTKQTKGIKVVVEGKLDGDTLKVTGLKEVAE